LYTKNQLDLRSRFDRTSTLWQTYRHRHCIP